MRLRNVAIGVLAACSALSAHAKTISHFHLFAKDSRIPDALPLRYVANQFGCKGDNVSPALSWRGAPPGTRSFVLTLFDPDERSTPSGWWHWVVYDLPPNTSSVPANAGAERSAALPKGALEGRTDLGNRGYVGPCPALGDPPHKYLFTLYALRVGKLPVGDGASGAMVTSVAQQYLLGKATLTVPYRR